jgi:replicative DNA helicase
VSTARVPPHDEVAERAALGACLASAEAIDEVAARVGPKDWYRPRHFSVWVAIQALRARGEPVDVQTLHSELAKKPAELEANGGASFLAELNESVVSAASVGFHADRIAACAQIQGATQYALFVDTRLGIQHEIGMPDIVGTQARKRGISGDKLHNRSWVSRSFRRDRHQTRPTHLLHYQ